MDKLKVGIIGCGNIFPMHAESIRQNKKGLIKAVCDIKPGKAKKSSKKYKAACYTDYKKMLKKEKLDVVHICTPHYLHKDMSIESLRSGVNVLQEKPMALNLKEAFKIAMEAKKSNKKYGIVFQNRFTPAALLSKRIISTGKIGKILSGKLFLTWHKPDSYYAKSDWKGTFDKEGGGVVIDQAIHSLDLLRWLFESDIKYVEASVFNRLHDVVKVEDEASGVVMFKSGAYINFYTMNHYSYDDDVVMEIHGEKGRIKIVKDSAKIYFYSGRNLSVKPRTEDYIDYGNGVKDYWGVCHSLLIDRFYDAVIKNKKIEINEDEGLKTQALVEAIYESSRINARLVLSDFIKNFSR